MAVFKLVKNDLGILDQEVDVTLGSTVADGYLVVLAGDDTYYDACADNATVVSGYLPAGGDVTESRGMLRIYPWQVWETTYTGTPNAGKVGSLVSINATHVIDVDDASNDICKLLSYDTVAGTCRVRFIATACESLGVEV